MDAITCAKRGDVDFFKTAAPDILLNARDEGGNSVLTVAAREGHLDCSEVIVERCPQLLYHQDNMLEWSVLHYVVALQQDNNRENIMRFLISADSKPDLERGGGAKLPNHSLLTMQDRWGSNALHWAVDRGNHGATKLLLEADRDFELLRMVDKWGQTCLHIAAEKGDHVAGEFIIKSRPDNEFLKMTGGFWKRTALHVAVKEGYLEMVKLICDADPDKQLLSMPDSQGNTPLHLAVENSNLSVAELFLEADHSHDLLAMINSDQQTALHIAAKTGNLDMVKLIWEADPDKRLLSMPDSDGYTPLYPAVRNGNLEIEQFLYQMVDMEAKDAITCAEIGNVEFFKTVAPDILLNARNLKGNSVLTVAATKGHLDCCEVIVERCPQLLYHQSITAKWSVLHFVACDKDNNLESIMRFLIAADSKPDLELDGGAKIPNHRLLTMRNKYGATALHKAVESGNHVATKLLLEADCDFELLRMVHEDDQTCLHVAAEIGDHVAAELMIKRRPDNEFLKMPKRRSHQTALHIAVEKKRLAIVQLLLEADYSNDLLVVADSRQRTALHYAVEQGNLDMVKLMCTAGLDNQLLSMPDYQGNTPLDWAKTNPQVEIVRVLTEAKLRLQNAIPRAKGGDVDFFKTVPPKILLRARAADGMNTVLTMAAREGHLDCCKVIVERCTPLLYHQDKHTKWSVLHCVICYGKGDDNVDNIMRFLISADGEGAKLPNKRLLMMRNIYGETALHFAVKEGNHRATKLLLEADRDFELRRMVDNNGRTCLHIAAERGDHVLVKLLEKMAV